MSRNLIRDNFTRQGYIEAAEGLHDELRFTYRPMLPEELELVELFRAQNGLDVKKTMRRMREEVAERLKSWSEVDEKNDTIPITVDSLKLLPPKVWEKLWLIVTGQRSVDHDPLLKGDGDDRTIAEQLGN